MIYMLSLMLWISLTSNDTKSESLFRIFRLPMHSVIPSVSPIMSSKQDFVKVQDQLQFYSLTISSCILFFLFRLCLLSVNLVRRGSTQNDICCHGGGERRIQYQNLKFLSFNILPSFVRLFWAELDSRL